MCGISLKDRRTNEELRRLVGVEPITTFIRSGRLRWYGYVMRKGEEDWVKKCMEYRVEGRRPVGRPRKTWLETVEVDMAELEIDKEDVHDRSKWRRIVNVMKRKSNPRVCEHRGTDGPRPAKNPSVRQTFPFSRPDCPAHIWLLCTHLHTL